MIQLAEFDVVFACRKNANFEEERLKVLLEGKNKDFEEFKKQKQLFLVSTKIFCK